MRSKTSFLGIPMMYKTRARIDDVIGNTVWFLVLLGALLGLVIVATTVLEQVREQPRSLVIIERA